MHRFFQVAKIYYMPIFATKRGPLKNANSIADEVTLFSVHGNQSITTVPDRTNWKPRSNFSAGLSERPLTFDVTFFTGEFSMTSQCFAVSKLRRIFKLKHIQIV